jgi:hypothetical protein
VCLGIYLGTYRDFLKQLINLSQLIPGLQISEDTSLYFLIDFLLAALEAQEDEKLKKAGI